MGDQRRFDGRSSCDDVLQGVDLSGRTMLVTGCNAGIGFETARSLATAGAHVLLAGRQLGDETAARIKASSPRAQVTPVSLDLASFDSVRRCAATLPAGKLDAVICNAGLYTARYSTTADGLERTVGVCHFGHFLLVSLLLDRLRAAAPARVVVVASESHRMPPTLNFERFPLSPERYQPLVAYGQAKLCNVLFANELSRRFGSQGVLANSLHPGTLMGTSIFRDSAAARLLALAVRPFTKSLAQGAATSVFCATAPDLEGVGGRYYVDCAEKKMSGGARDQTAASRLWDLTSARLGL